MKIVVLGRTLIEVSRESKMKTPTPIHKISLTKWNKMFRRTIDENNLKDQRLDQSLGEAAFSCTRGTVSSPLTNVGKYNLGRAFLTNSPKLIEAKQFIESNWPGQWKNVEAEVSSWLNPIEKKIEPTPDTRKYTYPCGHRHYHMEPGPRGILTCLKVGCGGAWKVETDDAGNMKLVEYRKPSDQK